MSKMPDSIRRAAEELSFGLVTLHVDDGCKVLIGRVEEVLGIERGTFEASGFEPLLTDAANDPRPWSTPCELIFAIRDERGAVRWLEARSKRTDDGALLVSTREMRLPAADALLSLARVSLAGSLLPAVCHEVNNVVQGLCAVEFLLRDCAERGQALDIEDLDQLDRSASSLRKMSALLQELTRMELAEAEPLDLRELLERIVELLRSTGACTTVAVELAIPDGLPRLRWRRSELHLLLSAVLFNGVQAAALGRHASLQVVVEDRAGHLYVGVRNTGQRFAPQGFLPFQTSKGSHRHVGLGLTAATAIATRRGGMLTCRGLPTGGTLVDIELPIQAAS